MTTADQLALLFVTTVILAQFSLWFIPVGVVAVLAFGMYHTRK